MAKQVKDKKWRIIRPPLGTGFYLPTREDLLKIKRGDVVKLIFQAGEDAPERMWVQVEKCGDSEHWTGRLDNDPAQEYLASVLKYKDVIRFHPLDVINIDSENKVPEEPSIEQIIDKKLGDVINSVNRPWYKNPNIMVPAAATIIVGLLSAVVTLIAALINKH